MKTEPLLVEILAEELPPKQLNFLSEYLANSLTEELNNKGFDSKVNKIFATPRRLAVLLNGIATTSKKEVKERRGPSQKVAFQDDGKTPSKALEGFLRSNKANVKDLIAIEYKGDKYVGVNFTSGGEKLNDVIGLIIDQIIAKTPSPRLMRWGNETTHFVRPIKHVLIVHGTKTLKVNVLNMDSATQTVGHRFLAPKQLKIDSAGNYEALLKKGHVIVDYQKRRELILKALTKITSKEKINENLLNESAAMCEQPSLQVCKFASKYLTLPHDLVIACMQKHIRSFPIYKKNILGHEFVFVADNNPTDSSDLIRGVERVIRARLDDTLFIYEEDLQVSKEELIDQTKNANFIVANSSVYDRCARVEKLSQFILKKIKKEADVSIVEKAAKYCKISIGTQVIDEYPEFEALMSKQLLEKTFGENNSEVLEIVGKHLDRSLDGISDSNNLDCLVLGLELDRILTLAISNHLPKGSGDPFGVRRSINRVLKILSQDKYLDFDLRKLFDDELDKYISLVVAKSKDQSVNLFEAKNLIEKLFFTRMQHHSTSLFNINTTISQRILKAALNRLHVMPPENYLGPVSIASIKKICIALDDFEKNYPKKYELFIEGAKRIENIFYKDNLLGYNKKSLGENERAFYDQIIKIRDFIKDRVKDHNYLAALELASDFTKDVNHFIDNFQINSEVEEERFKRQYLMQSVNFNIYNYFVDTKALYR